MVSRIAATVIREPAATELAKAARRKSFMPHCRLPRGGASMSSAGIDGFSLLDERLNPRENSLPSLTVAIGRSDISGKAGVLYFYPRAAGAGFKFPAQGGF